MKHGIIRYLWKYSALPILLFASILGGVGIYLQRAALRVQKLPIVTVVSPETFKNIISEDLFFEQADYIDSTGAGDGPLSEASNMMRDGNDREGIRILEDYIRENIEAAGNPRIMLTLAQAYIRLEEYASAEASLELIPGETGYEARVLFNKALIQQRTGDSNLAISHYREAIRYRPTYFEATYNLGGLLLQSGRLDEAVLTLSEAGALAGGERKARAIYNLGLALTRTEQYGEALEAFETAIRFQPSHLSSRTAIAGIYFRNLNQPESAETLYQETLDLSPAYGPAYVGLARIEMERSNPDLAEEYLRTSLSKNPTYDAARRVLATLLTETERTSEARRELIWIRDNGSDKVEATYQLGRIEYSEGNFDKAVEYYKESFNLSDGRHAQSLNNLGLALKAAGKPAESRTAFSKAISIDPVYANAYYNLGLLELEREHFPEAEKAFMDCVEINPESAAAWHNLGLVWSASGRNRKAMEAYEESLRIHPSNVKARLNLAVLYRREGYTTRALEQYHLVLSLNPSYASAWFNLAVLQKSEGDVEGAERSYMEAVTLDPENEIYRKNLSVLYSTLGRTEDAIDVLNEALVIHPDSGPLRYLLALQFRKTGEETQGLREMERCVAVAPDYVKGWIGLADIQSGMNLHEDAIKSLEMAQSLDPDDADTVYQLGKEYLALKDYSPAIEYFMESTLVIRDNAWIWYHLGKAYQASDREDLAEEAYQTSLLIDSTMGRFIYARLDRIEESLQVRQEMIKQNPTDIGLKIDFAMQLKRAGRLDEALEILIEASSADPGNALIWNKLGSIYVELDERESADRSFRKAYSADSSSTDIALDYSNFLIQDSRPDQAVSIISTALEIVPEHPELLRLLGDAQYKLRAFPIAVEAYRQAWEINQDSGLIAIDLGKAYYRNKDYEPAAEAFRIGVDLLPDYTWAHVWLGRSLNRLELFGEAESVYLEAIELEPDFIQAYIGLGDVADTRGDAASALGYYREVLNIDPSHDSTRRKIERIEASLE